MQVVAGPDAGPDAGEPAVTPLTASVSGVPAEHDGENAFSFRILFSEGIAIGYKTLRDESLATTGGAVTGARRVDGRNDLWEIAVEPEGDADVTVTLAGGRTCDTAGAVCTPGGVALSATVSLTVAGPESDPGPPLTASFSGVPAEHDGESAFSFRILFSEAIGISYTTMRDESVSATGGAVTGARRVDGRNDLWEIAVEPSGDADVTVTLAGGRACGTAGAVCTPGGVALSATVSLTVAGPESDPGPGTPEPPLTASFSGVPAEHTGSGTFTFRILFSEAIGIGYTTMRDESVSATGGAVTGARRVDGRNDLWEIAVEPSGDAHVTVTLAGGRACGTAGAVCTRTGEPRPLANSPSATVRAQAALSVADAKVQEGPGASVDFTVSPEPRGIGDGDGGVRHLERHRDGGRGLHGRERHAAVRGGRDVEDDCRIGARRRARRGARDVHAEAEQCLGRADRRRHGDGDDRELRSHAAGVAVAVRPRRLRPRGPGDLGPLVRRRVADPADALHAWRTPGAGYG